MACKKAFNKLCVAFISALILCYYLLELETIIEIDAFNGVVAGIFS
jgi:hypothetical protein